MAAADLAKGKWVLESSDKFDEYMKEIGVGKSTRFIVTKLKPNIEIDVKDDTWTIKTLSTFKNTESTFKLNESYKETTADGREVEALCTVEGNKLIRTEKGTVSTVITREFSENEFTLKMECNDVVCTRVYKKSDK